MQIRGSPTLTFEEPKSKKKTMESSPDFFWKVQEIFCLIFVLIFGLPQLAVVKLLGLFSKAWKELDKPIVEGIKFGGERK